MLLEEAPWALAYSQAPLTLPPSGGLDSRGAEEEGLAGPAIAAAVVAGDSYLLVNDRDQDMEAYDHSGRLLWRVPCLARGQGRDNQWRQRNSDTPPGLYKLGAIYSDREANSNPPCSDTAMACGWYSFDMEELEGQEAANDRAGIMLHGGVQPAAGPAPGSRANPCTPPSAACGSTTSTCAFPSCPWLSEAPPTWGCCSSDRAPSPSANSTRSHTSSAGRGAVPTARSR